MLFDLQVALWHTFVCLYLRGLCRCCRWPGYCCWCHGCASLPPSVGLLHIQQGVGSSCGAAQSWGIRGRLGVPDAQLPWPKGQWSGRLGVHTSCLTSAASSSGMRAEPPASPGSQAGVIQDWNSSLCLRPAFSTCPTHPPSDAQIQGTLQRPDVLSRGIFVELWYFTDYILKGKETEIISFHSDAGHIVKMPFST